MKKVTDFLNHKKGIIKHLPIRGCMKIRTKAMNIQVQKYLFEHGYSWNGGTEVEDFHTIMKPQYLFWYNDGQLCYGESWEIDEQEAPEVNYFDHFMTPN